MNLGLLRATRRALQEQLKRDNNPYQAEQLRGALAEVEAEIGRQAKKLAAAWGNDD